MRTCDSPKVDNKKTILAKLFTDAQADPGNRKTAYLDKTQVQCTVNPCLTIVQISQTNGYPNWQPIWHNWPFELPIRPKQCRAQGRYYLSVLVPTQSRLFEAIPADSDPTYGEN